MRDLLNSPFDQYITYTGALHTSYCAFPHSSFSASNGNNLSHIWNRTSLDRSASARDLGRQSWFRWKSLTEREFNDDTFLVSVSLATKGFSCPVRRVLAKKRMGDKWLVGLNIIVTIVTSVVRTDDIATAGRTKTVTSVSHLFTSNMDISDNNY